MLGSFRPAILLLILLQCLTSRAGLPIVDLGSFARGTTPFVAKLQQLFAAYSPNSDIPKRPIVIASVGNSITSANYLEKHSQYGEVLAKLLKANLNIPVDHRNLGIQASFCIYNYYCVPFKGDEDIIIDANLNTYRWNGSVGVNMDCANMLDLEMGLQSRPAVISMHMSIPMGFASKHIIDMTALTNTLASSYESKTLAVIGTANFMKSKQSKWYFDDIHPSAHGHFHMALLLFDLINCSLSYSMSQYDDISKGSQVIQSNVISRQCIKARDFITDLSIGPVHNGVKLLNHTGWNFAERGVLTGKEVTAGMMRDSKYSWLATVPGSTLEIQVYASSISLVYYSNLYGMGKVQIYVNDTATQSFDGYFEGFDFNRTRGLNKVRRIRMNAINGSHLQTIRIVLLNESNPKVRNPRNEFQVIALLYSVNT